MTPERPNGPKTSVLTSPNPEHWRRRIAANVVTDDAGCWIWQGKPNWNGYGTFTFGRHGQTPAHRASWIAFQGDIAEGLVVDHLCRVKLCVNPDHLEPVTNAVNVERGELAQHRGDKYRGATHCVHGHEFTPENTLTRRDGYRACKSCAQARARETYQRRKANGYFDRRKAAS